jgi:hypothetical protein
MRIEVDHRQRPGRVSLGDGCNIGERDRMIASENDRDRAGIGDPADGFSKRPVIEMCIARPNHRVAMVHDLKFLERIEPKIHVPCPGRSAKIGCSSDRAGTEPSTRSVSDHLVHRRPYEGNVDPLQFLGIPDESDLLERLQAGVRGFARTA